MSNVTLDDKFVLLCDWHGRVVWGAATIERVRPGELAWKYLRRESQERAKEALARAVALCEKQVLELVSDRRDHFRAWLWPLGAPDVAVCVLGVRIPSELALLTARERECLAQLADGRSTNDIAKRLGIALTTVHTHLRKSREKLGLPSGDALIAFAARYCQPEHAARNPCGDKMANTAAS